MIALFLVIVSLTTQIAASERSSFVPAQDSGLDLLIKKRIAGWTTPSKIVIGGGEGILSGSYTELL